MPEPQQTPGQGSFFQIPASAQKKLEDGWTRDNARLGESDGPDEEPRAVEAAAEAVAAARAEPPRPSSLPPVTREQMTEIEWPKGSGRFADYTPAEFALMKGITLQCARNEITRDELQNQMDTIHDLKTLGDAWLVEETPTHPPLSAVPSEPTGDPGRAHARVADPATSHAAAAAVGRREELRATQVAVLEVFKEYGLMHDEVLVQRYEEKMAEGKLPIQRPSGIRSRRSELVGQGLIRDSGDRVTLESNCKSNVWELV